MTTETNRVETKIPALADLEQPRQVLAFGKEAAPERR
jgi:hypothetical protein